MGLPYATVDVLRQHWWNKSTSILRERRKEVHGMEAEYQRYDGVTAKTVADELVGTYSEVYSVPPYVDDPFFTVDMFGDRLHRAFGMPGFETVTARVDGQVVGLVHGVTLMADKPWWVSLDDRAGDKLRTAVENGEVFWLRELMVRPKYGRQGLGRQLHDTIIAGREETATALTCVIGNEPAHSAYLRWGYRIMGQIKHAPESPVYDAMVLSSHPM
ncbi:GNAT family N-acetyltransferase [Streptomyces katsurahamanus]|uniref:GNAT family N-acetyltransferase n=2 Tax=Streptomyces katsurahamanus TaxID=2577098 RepID=A0ABW9NRK0_9ACTN|nr:GNAT family N-acetyltransferase [Streptomyces katsurahamanus]